MPRPKMLIPRDLDPWPDGAEGESETGVAVENFAEFANLLSAHSAKYRALDRRSRKIVTAAMQYVMLFANQPTRNSVVVYLCELFNCRDHASRWREHWTEHASDIHLAIKECLGIVAENGPFLVHSILTEALQGLHKKQRMGVGPDGWTKGDHEVLNHAVRVYGLAPDPKSKSVVAPARARLTDGRKAIELTIGGGMEGDDPETPTRLPSARSVDSDADDDGEGQDDDGAELGTMLHGLRAHRKITGKGRLPSMPSTGDDAQ